MRSTVEDLVQCAQISGSILSVPKKNKRKECLSQQHLNSTGPQVSPSIIYNFTCDKFDIIKSYCKMYLHVGANHMINVVMVSFDHTCLAPLTTLSWVLSDLLVLAHQMSARLQLVLASLRTRVPSWQERDVPLGGLVWGLLILSILDSRDSNPFPAYIGSKEPYPPTAPHYTSFDSPTIHKITTRWQNYPITIALPLWRFISESSILTDIWNYRKLHQYTSRNFRQRFELSAELWQSFQGLQFGFLHQSERFPLR